MDKSDRNLLLIGGVLVGAYLLRDKFGNLFKVGSNIDEGIKNLFQNEPKETFIEKREDKINKILLPTEAQIKRNLRGSKTYENAPDVVIIDDGINQREFQKATAKDIYNISQTAARAAQSGSLKQSLSNQIKTTKETTKINNFLKTLKTQTPDDKKLRKPTIFKSITSTPIKTTAKSLLSRISSKLRR